MDRPLVLLTGADGHIGRAFRDDHREHYAGFYDLRLGVRRIDAAHRDSSDVVEANIEDLGAMRAACRGVDTVVHLAASPDWQADFCDTLVGPNILGAYHVFEAARAEGCRRVVYASSVHAVMGYPVDFQAHVTDPPRADTMYGVTKVFGEALCSSFAYEHGLSCIAVRIGAFVARGDEGKVIHSDNPQLLDIVISQRDMSELLHRCIIAPESVRYAVVNGLSDNRYKRMDLEETKRLLGYAPQDDAFRWSVEVELGEEVKV